MGVELMELTEHTFAELSFLTHRIFTTRLPNVPSQDVLIVAFEGEYGYGCKGNGDATYIHAMLTAAEAAWQTSFLVLDYRAMSYQWGNRLPLDWGPEQMTKEETKIVRLFGGVPKCTAVLVSDQCRDGIASLISSKEMYGPRAGSGIPWLFDDLEAALAVFEQVLLQ